MIFLSCLPCIYITAQDLPHKNANQPLLYPGLHPRRQLRRDGPHPLRHPYHTQSQALSGYQGEVKFECISICICICTSIFTRIFLCIRICIFVCICICFSTCIYRVFVFLIPFSSTTSFFSVNSEWAEIPYIYSIFQAFTIFLLL